MKMTLSEQCRRLLSSVTEPLKELTGILEFRTAAFGVAITAAGADWAAKLSIPEHVIGEYVYSGQDCAGFGVDLGIFWGILQFAAGKILSIETVGKNVMYKIANPAAHEELESHFVIKGQSLTPNSPEVGEENPMGTIRMPSRVFAMVLNHCELFSGIVAIRMQPRGITFESSGDDGSVKMETMEELAISVQEEPQGRVNRYNLKNLKAFEMLGSLADEIEIRVWGRNKYPLMLKYRISGECSVTLLLKADSCFAKAQKIIFKGFRIVAKLLWKNKEHVLGCLLSGCGG